jgi:transcription initiation factor TFIIIB Brf1 subunit/transcription initiation factor TFIIB
MYMSEIIARQRNAERLKEAQQERSARQVSELRKLERVSHRAERKLLSAWERSDELRSQLAL